MGLSAALAEALTSEAGGVEEAVKPKDPGFGKIYGGKEPAYQTSKGPVWMWRKGQKVRFYTADAKQVGPEQSNVAPAASYAHKQGWRWESAPGGDLDTMFAEAAGSKLEKEEEFVAGLEKRLRPEMERLIRGTGGKVVSVHGYAPAKGGGWAVVFNSEYAALKVYYKYRHGKVNLDKNPKGWVISVR